MNLAAGFRGSGIGQCRPGQARLAKVGKLLLVAGHETTSNMIALGTAALLQNPGQLAEIRDSGDPGLVAGVADSTTARFKPTGALRETSRSGSSPAIRRVNDSHFTAMELGSWVR